MASPHLGGEAAYDVDYEVVDDDVGDGEFELVEDSDGDSLPCSGAGVSAGAGREGACSASERLRAEAAAWCPPAPPAHEGTARFARWILTEGLLPALLEAHAAGGWTEHHICGLLDREDARLPARSPPLVARLRERLVHTVVSCHAGECGAACGAFARAALYSNGWADAYLKWAACSRAAGREADVPAIHAIAVERGVWQHPLQRPNALYVPGLRALPFWEPAAMPAVAQLEAAFPVILREYLALREQPELDGFTPIAERQLVRHGSWTEFKLRVNGRWHAVNCLRCPETVRVVQERCPEAATMVRGSLMFSRLTGSTAVRPHCGPTNARLRVHLALEVPEPPPWIRVGEEWRTWEVGRCLVFDDSFEHEVVHSGGQPRVVLIADLWHPEFEDTQRRRYLQGRDLRRYEGAAASERRFELHSVEEADVRFLEAELRGVQGVREAVATLHRDAVSDQQVLLAHVEAVGHSAKGVRLGCASVLRARGLEARVRVATLPRLSDGSVDRARVARLAPEELRGTCGARAAETTLASHAVRKCARGERLPATHPTLAPASANGTRTRGADAQGKHPAWTADSVCAGHRSQGYLSSVVAD